MQEALVWWVILEVVGVVAFPIAFATFRFLPDRGYAFAKPLGLVVIGYAIWIASTLELLPNRQGSLITILLLLAVASAVVVRNQPSQLVAFLRGKLGYILVVEALFTAAFAYIALHRAWYPDIYYGEKPMNFAFLNALMRSEELPPPDPWLSGHTLSYYYFGHLIISVVARLGDIPSSIAFNLGLPMVAGLAAIAVFAVIYNMVVERGGALRATLFGLAGAVVLLIAGNLEGLFELLAVHGIGSTGFYDVWDIAGLEGPRSSTAWYPTEPWWWMRAGTIAGGSARDVPFRGFLFGDIHSIFMSPPFVLLTVGLALNLFRVGQRLDAFFWRERPLLLLVTAVVIGAAGFVNLWDLPTCVGLVTLVALAANLARGDGMVRGLVGAVSLGLPVAALAVLLYSPFHATFHPVAEGFHPWEIARREYGSPETAITSPNHFVIIWLPMIWLFASLVVAGLARARHIVLPLRTAAWALVPAGLPLLLWAGAVAYRRGLDGFGEEVGERGTAWLTALILAAVTTAAVLALLKQARLGARGQANLSGLFALVLGTAAVLLILGTEFFWVRESPPWRFTTLWKTSYQAWILLSVAGVFALYYIAPRWSPKLSRRTVGFALWGGATFALLGASMLYPLMATFSMGDSFRAGRHLDGLLYTRLSWPLEYEAIRWLDDNVEGTPVVLEAVGEDFSLAAPARVSTRTGLPTVLGWPDHEYRWRGSWEPQAGRRDAVEKIYTSPDSPEAKALLDKYEVEYVYVGKLERDTYGEEGLHKFATFMEVAYRNEDVIIYRVR